MTKLDDHIGRVEEYGFERAKFPLSYKGHELHVLSNDAYLTDDGRLLFDFTLFCHNCRRESGLSGRFPANCDEQFAGVVNAKVASFETFKYEECE